MAQINLLIIQISWLIINLFASQIKTTEPGSARDGWLVQQRIANEIYDQQATIEINQLLYKLNILKSVLCGEVTQHVPLKLGSENQKKVASALALFRLTEISIEKCYYGSDRLSEDQFHRGHYLELEQLLLTKYKSENMAKIIKNYADIQFLLCSNSLLHNFTRTVEKRRARQDQHERFTSVWNECFSGLKSGQNCVANMSLEDKTKGIVRFMNRYFDQKDLLLMNESVSNFAALYKLMFKETCEQYYLEPFGALMMTYDKFKRESLPELERLFPMEIRAYDICKELQVSVNDEELVVFKNGVELALHGIESVDIQQINPIPLITQIEPIEPIGTSQPIGQARLIFQATDYSSSEPEMVEGSSPEHDSAGNQFDLFPNTPIQPESAELNLFPTRPELIAEHRNTRPISDADNQVVDKDVDLNLKL